MVPSASTKAIHWALVDQTLVSGCNFLTGIFLARWMGLEGFGYYTLILSVVYYLNSFQTSLILAPMSSIGTQLLDDGQFQHYFGSSFVMQFGLSLGLSLLTIAIGFMAERLIHLPWLSGVWIPLGLGIIFIQLQDWLRRYLYIRERAVRAFVLDVISYGGQVLLLVALTYHHSLTLTTAMYAIALSSGAAFLTVFAIEKPPWRWEGLIERMRLNWPLGRDVFVSTQLHWAGNHGVLLMVAGVLGAAEVGGIRAAINILGPFNILLQALENVVPAKAAQIFSRSDFKGLSSYLGRVAGYGTVVFLAFGFVLTVVSSQALSLAYGANYAPFAIFVPLQLAYLYLSFLGRTESYFHRTLKTTPAIIKASMLATTFTVLFTFPIIRFCGPVGLFYSLIAGQIVNLLVLRYVIHSAAALPHSIR